MNNIFLRNRTSFQLIFTLLVILMFYNFITSSADSIEGSELNTISEQENLEIISVSIPPVSYTHLTLPTNREV